jgi:hypothetical protein
LAGDGIATRPEGESLRGLQRKPFHRAEHPFAAATGLSPSAYRQSRR